MSQSFIAEQALVSPITHAGRVVYNAQRDWLETRWRKRKGDNALRAYAGFGDDASHTIQQFELTVRNRGNRYMQWTPSDTDVRVFSNGNGIKVANSTRQEYVAKLGGGGVVVPFNDSQYDRLRLLKRDRLQFGGIASNRAIYDPKNNANEEHLAVQVGGLTTIYNTGDKTINTGDVILWDMPCVEGTTGISSIRIAGIPKNKLLFSTKVLDPETSFDQEKKEYCQLMFGQDNAVGKPNPSDAIIFHRLNRRIIGRAFSSAGPAKPFDILLGRYMC
jgi:hypothetical protein